MKRGARDAFERRFTRGLVTPELDEGVAWIDHVCQCGKHFYGYPDLAEPKCFTCSNATNPFALKNISMSMDATCEPSRDPSRIKDGTSGFNMGLPGKVYDYGAPNAYGQRPAKQRPIAHNEVASTRRLKDMAKRAGLSPVETAKRALPR